MSLEDLQNNELPLYVEGDIRLSPWQGFLRLSPSLPRWVQCICPRILEQIVEAGGDWAYKMDGHSACAMLDLHQGFRK